MVGKDDKEIIDYKGDYRPSFHRFFDLMKFKVTKILLVSSLYDAFTLEEDSMLYKQISGEYSDLELSSPPQIIRASSGEEALRELASGRYDMIITMARISDLDPFVFGERAKDVQPGIPVVLLITEAGDIPQYHRHGRKDGIDKVFFWNGDSTLLLAITKYVEDMVNVVPDTRTGAVRVILIVEDSPRFYSMFLPIIYTEIMRQTIALMAEGLNEHEKFLRKRARPKILLTETFEEAMDFYDKYKEQILAVVTDVTYPHEGKDEKGAGFRLIGEIDENIPVLLQSSQMKYKIRADELGIPFLDKRSDTLLQELRNFFKDCLGFGGFVFSTPEGKEVGLAINMNGFIDMVKKIPAESIRYHGLRNDYSKWFMARGEIGLAKKLRPKKVSDFKADEDIRTYLLDALRESRLEKQMGVITDFSQHTFEFDRTFTRFGGGSLGGKGRGLAFLSMLLHQSNIQRKFSKLKIQVPDTLVIGTDEFDRFLNDNNLQEVLGQNPEDDDIRNIFMKEDVSSELKLALTKYLEHIDCPLAIRSSSLLEDSQNQPFAGIYATYILPNNCPDKELRLEQLCQAIKLVYASVFCKAAKAYIQTTVHMAEEEKMAVVIQKLAGNHHGDRFYPLFSGVAQSYNFYPVAPLKREDGMVSVALGLGQIVVEGEKVLSFSPKHPGVIPGFGTPEDTLKNTQHRFYSLNMLEACYDLSINENVTLLSEDIPGAEKDGTLDYLASTYDANDNRLRDGIGTSGPRAITFAGVLKYRMLPLVDIINELLELGEKGMGRPVEIEFACSLEVGESPVFHILQIRPLVTLKEHKEVHVTNEEIEGAFIYTNKALGNGILKHIYDIAYVPPDLFDAGKTREIAKEIGEINKELDGAPYILIGPGRWGTRDRWLGIPVEWDQISSASTMVEVSLEDFRIDPSHGTHFFHNITSLGIMYFTVPLGKSAHIDWNWLQNTKPFSEKEHVKHIRLGEPLLVKVDGRSGKGIITQNNK
jgi:hypothetical protein